MTEPELIEAIKVYRFEPGDRLVMHLKSDRYPTQQAMEDLRQTLKSWAPDTVVLVLPDGISIEVVRGL